jgi:hypothetical protein
MPVMRILKLVAGGLLGLAVLAYVLDSMAVAFPGSRQIYEDVRVDQIFTDTNKWHEVEYSRGLPTTERCVDALFPHGSYKPCWYLKKHTMQTTNTD